MPKRKKPLGKIIKPTSKELRDRLGKPNADGEDAGKRLSRRQRAKLKNAEQADKELNDPVVNNPRAKLEPKPRGRGDSGLLLTDSDPAKLNKDIQLVEKSIKRGWNVRRKPMLRRRLEDIAMKTVGDMNTKDGIVESETVADKLAIDAIKVLVAMDNQDMTRVKNHQPEPEAPKSEVNVNVTIDARQSQLVELANKLGARELVINGQPVSTLPHTVQVDRISNSTTDSGTDS